MSKKYLIRGDEWEGDHIEETINFIRDIDWRYGKFKATPSLNYLKEGELSSARPYTGQSFDPEKYVVDPVGWNHEHCEVCWWTLAETDDPEVAYGYTDGDGLWLCKECHGLFIANEPKTRS